MCKTKLADVLAAMCLLIVTAPAFGEDGGLRSPARENSDAGAPAAGRRSGRTAGAFLGPLPDAAGRGDVGGDSHYSLSPRPDGSLVYESPQFTATIAPNGAVTFHDHRVRYSNRDVGLVFDLSDELTPGTHYSAEKAKFIAATAERRAEMAKRAYSIEVQAALDEIPKRLDALWADKRYRRRERRRIIYMLWEEADSTDAGKSAARAMEAWIRRRLPFGSPGAYTDAELQAIARERVGRPRFSPYGSLLDMRPAQQ